MTTELFLLLREINKTLLPNRFLADMVPVPLPVRDTEWKWDQFSSPNAYGSVWVCRGTSSGKFSEDEKCAGTSKMDDTWPNN